MADGTTYEEAQFPFNQVFDLLKLPASLFQGLTGVQIPLGTQEKI
jgi:hypothetical protein